MKFEQSFNQKQNQQLKMTTHLSQAIAILQYNSEELLSFIEDKVLGNPLIEIIQPSNDFIGSSDDIFQMTTNSTEEFDRFSQLSAKKQSLLEFIVSQVYMNYRDTPLRKIILFLVEFIDSNGYFKFDLEKISESNNQEYVDYLDALTLIQQLEPAGIGARDLRECLMLQTERDDAAPTMTYQILEEDFENFINKKWQEIAKKYNIPLSNIQTISDYIKNLTPNPGADFDESLTTVIYPDLRVDNENNLLTVYSTKYGEPELIFQENYYNELTSYNDSETNKFLTEKKHEFKWLQDSLAYRTETILKVGLEIVNYQKDFFRELTRVVKPLTLSDIAEKVNVHESTVSRAVKGKYIETTFGVFELDHFFSTKLTSHSGGIDYSSDYVQQLIGQIINDEDSRKPLSDQKIVVLLNDKDINISRRTVAKYRDILGIASSSQRKRYD